MNTLTGFHNIETCNVNIKYIRVNKYRGNNISANITGRNCLTIHFYPVSCINIRGKKQSHPG